MKKSESRSGNAPMHDFGCESILERTAFMLTRLIGMPYIVERLSVAGTSADARPLAGTATADASERLPCDRAT
jgi:hypothetical protein